MRSCLVMTILSCANPAVAVDTLYDNRFKQWSEEALQGDANAQYNLGNAYLRGNETEVNVNKSIEWFGKAAKQDHVKAKFKLGYLYLSGKGVAQDYDKARTWLQQAADGGYSPAQFHLGKIYSEGKGVRVNLEQATFWFRKALEQNYARAEQELSTIQKRLDQKNTTGKERSRNQPKPERVANATYASKTTSKKKYNYKKILLTHKWRHNKEPAEKLPSGLNTCTQEQGQISCKTSKLNRFTAYAEITYQVESSLSNFTKDGKFELRFRTNNIFVLPEDADDPNPEYEIPAMGMQPESTVFKCNFSNTKTIACQNGEQAKLSFVRQKG